MRKASRRAPNPGEVREAHIDVDFLHIHWFSGVNENGWNPQSGRGQAMIENVLSNDEGRQIEGITQFRSLLARNLPPINSVIESGVLPRFVQFLSSNNLVLQVSELDLGHPFFGSFITVYLA